MGNIITIGEGMDLTEQEKEKAKLSDPKEGKLLTEVEADNKQLS
jgi:hypothetical protein